MEGMGSWWAPFQVSGPISPCTESWMVTLDHPSLLLSDHDALTDHGPWSFRSPRLLYSQVHCLRGSNHHSGEWYGGGAACICKFPQTVFSFQWVMNLFSLFEALAQRFTHDPEPVLEHPRIPVLSGFYTACACTTAPLPENPLTLLFKLHLNIIYIHTGM